MIIQEKKDNEIKKRENHTNENFEEIKMEDYKIGSIDNLKYKIQDYILKWDSQLFIKENIFSILFFFIFIFIFSFLLKKILLL